MTPTHIVTGGAGFIGSNIVKALNKRGIDRIIVVDHLDNPLKNRNLDRIQFTDYLDKVDFRKSLRSGKMSAVKGVFHMGACSSTTEMDEDYLHDNNYLYTKELCEWSLACGARFVYASSAATYGDGSRGYSDDDSLTPDLEPLNPYGKSKQKFDLWALESGVVKQIAGLKYFNVYGPGEDHKGEMRSLVNKAFDQIRSTGLIRLFKSYRPEYRNGEQTRDFVYVDAAVAVTLFFYDHPEVSGIFNCGTGEARTWLALALALFEAMDLPPQIEFIDMPESIRERYQYHTQAETTKLRSAGCNLPFTSIETGIKRYVDEYLTIEDR